MAMDRGYVRCSGNEGRPYPVPYPCAIFRMSVFVARLAPASVHVITCQRSSEVRLIVSPSTKESLQGMRCSRGIDGTAVVHAMVSAWNVMPKMPAQTLQRDIFWFENYIWLVRSAELKRGQVDDRSSGWMTSKTVLGVAVFNRGWILLGWILDGISSALIYKPNSRYTSDIIMIYPAQCTIFDGVDIINCVIRIDAMLISIRIRLSKVNGSANEVEHHRSGSLSRAARLPLANAGFFGHVSRRSVSHGVETTCLLTVH